MPTPAFLTVPSLLVPISLPSLATRMCSVVEGAPAASALPPMATTSAVSATAMEILDIAGTTRRGPGYSSVVLATARTRGQAVARNRLPPRGGRDPLVPARADSRVGVHRAEAHGDLAARRRLARV